MSKSDHQFRETLKRDLDTFVNTQKERFPAEETLVIDLHCHDHHSDVPDELLGRILHWPETWVLTDEVREILARNGATALTITNHNNARSCFELLERGIDVLVGAEFTCTVPDFNVQVHVLTYGFSPSQEERLRSLRSDIYRFLTYAREQDLVTVLAHPLYFHSSRQVPTLPLLEKLTLLFDNFEVLNGQRDTWQNLLVVAWLQSLSELRIADMSSRAGIRPGDYCQRPVRKAMTGGSDDHMALFVGTTGTRVHVPDLANRLQKEPRSALVLEALKRGSIAPFGSYTAEEKLTASFLDYFCQIVMHAPDPGLVRVLLHQGSARQKIWALLIANAMSELRRHRYTSRFIEAAHAALHGTNVGFMQKYVFAKEYRPLVDELDRIAGTHRDQPSAVEDQLRSSIPAIFHQLTTILAERIKSKVVHYQKEHPVSSLLALQELVERLELPVNLRALFGETDQKNSTAGMSNIDLASIAEGLPFPAMAALIIGGSAYTSAKMLFANRPLLDEFSQAICRYRHPRRVLWLTDNFTEQNAVGRALRLMHAEVARRHLPVDFAVCHASLSPDDHLKILNPVVQMPLPHDPQQSLRVFDILQLQQLFISGGYDRVVCSTEGLMGLAALYLKNAFSVPATFFLHIDWLDFARRALNLDVHYLDRVRRLLRAFYRGFDRLLVLNTEHGEWLRSDAMGIEQGRLRQTAYWPDHQFGPRQIAPADIFPGVLSHERVLLYVGRLTEDKGVMELPDLLKAVRAQIPNARLVVAGTGPAQERLRALVPDGVFLSWVDTEKLAQVYNAADLLVLPSRGDTFGRVVVEALASGLPVVAYRTQGPKDIIQDGVCGYTVDDQQQFAAAVTRILHHADLQKKMRAAAINRASEYRPDRIVGDLLGHLNLVDGAPQGLADEPLLLRAISEENELVAWHEGPT